MSQPTFRFESFLDRFIELYYQGAYEEALELIDTHSPLLPEIAPQLLAWRSALLARLGRIDEALQTLREADARGYWYHERALRDDPDFAALQSQPEFATLVERFSVRRAETAPKIREETSLSLPDEAGPHPLCLVLHGNSSNILETEPRWKPITTQGWALACLQSSQPSWTIGTYVWNDVPRALNEVQAQLEALAQNPAITAKTVIAGGFSMGAHAAVYMALDPRFQLRGVIAHEAWFNEEAMIALEQAIQQSQPNATRIVLIAGRENAEYVGMANKVRDLLTARGFGCLRIDSANPRHGYPDDFAQVIQDAAAWIMA